MNDDVKFAFALSCLIPGIVGVITFKKLDNRFHPLVYLLLLAFVTEIAQRICIAVKRDDISDLISNVYLLVNFVLHVWFFYGLGIIKTVRAVIIYLNIFTIVFIANGVFKSSIFLLYEIALIASYIIILKLCIDGLVTQTFDASYKWTHDALFLFCATNIIYSAYLIFSFSLRFFGIPTDTSINVAVASFYYYINAGCYLLTLWVVLCIPRKNYIGLFF